jgi:hypothetical protein
VDPALEIVDKGLGIALVAGLAIALAENRPLGVAAELPGPFLVLVKGRVEEPVDLALELVRGAARDQLAAHDPLGGLGDRLILVHEIVTAKGALDGQEAIGLEGRAGLGGKQAASLGPVLLLDRLGDALQAGTFGVDLAKELGVGETRANGFTF